MTGETILMGQACLELHGTEAAIRRAIRDNVIQVPRVGGKYYAFPVADLPQIRAKLIEAGYIAPTVGRPEPVATV